MLRSLQSREFGEGVSKRLDRELCAQREVIERVNPGQSHHVFLIFDVPDADVFVLGSGGSKSNFVR